MAMVSGASSNEKSLPLKPIKSRSPADACSETKRRFSARHTALTLWLLERRPGTAKQWKRGVTLQGAGSGRRGGGKRGTRVRAESELLTCGGAGVQNPAAVRGRGRRNDHEAVVRAGYEVPSEGRGALEPPRGGLNRAGATAAAVGTLLGRPPGRLPGARAEWQEPAHLVLNGHGARGHGARGRSEAHQEVVARRSREADGLARRPAGRQERAHGLLPRAPISPEFQKEGGGEEEENGQQATGHRCTLGHGPFLVPDPPEVFAVGAVEQPEGEAAAVEAGAGAGGDEVAVPAQRQGGDGARVGRLPEERRRRGGPAANQTIVVAAEDALRRRR